MHEVTEAWRHRRLVFGVADCFQYVAAHVLAIRGVDHRLQFPSYDSRDRAMAIVEEHGGVIALITGVLGQPKPVSQVHRGDLVARDFGDGIAPAVCHGVYCSTLGPAGLVFETTAGSLAAWSV